MKKTINAENAEFSASGKKKKLWVVTELYYPEDNQTGYYLTGIAEGLAEEFDVKVICGQPNYAARGTRAAKREVRRAVEIFRVWGTTFDKNKLPLRLVNMLTLGFSMFFKTLFKIGARDEIIVVSAPPTLPFITAAAAKMRGVPYNLIVQDKYPETLTAVGVSKPDSLFIKFLSRANTLLYSQANIIVVVGRDMAELIENQLNASGKLRKTRIEVVQNWASLEEIEPQPKKENQLLKELGLTEKFVFLYAGNMGHPQDVESIARCAEKLRDDERFHFLFIGSGVKRKWLERFVKFNDLENATVLQPLPRAEQNKFLNACDVGFVSLVKGMRGVAMPSRTYNLLAAGKPILALTEENSEVARLLAEDNAGWHVAPENPEKLLEIIYQIYERKIHLPAIGANGRAAALKKHTSRTAIEKYKKILT